MPKWQVFSKVSVPDHKYIRPDISPIPKLRQATEESRTPNVPAFCFFRFGNASRCPYLPISAEDIEFEARAFGGIRDCRSSDARLAKSPTRPKSPAIGLLSTKTPSSNTMPTNYDQLPSLFLTPYRLLNSENLITHNVGVINDSKKF